MKLLYFMLLSIFGAEVVSNTSPENNDTVETTMCNWAKKVYMESICSPFNGKNKTFNLGIFNVTVVKVNCVVLRLMQTCSFQECCTALFKFYNVTENDCTDRHENSSCDLYALMMELKKTKADGCATISFSKNLKAQTDQQQQTNLSCNSNKGCCLLLLLFSKPLTSHPTLLICLFSVCTVNSGENFFNYNNTEIQIAENLSTVVCKWNGSQCYVECTAVNLTINLTGIINIPSAIIPSNYNQNKTFVFNISEQETTCKVTVCETNPISTLIEIFLSSGDWKHFTQIQKMCSELFASDESIKISFISAEKKYIDNLINLPFNETTENYDLEEFNMTVVKINRMNTTDHGRVKISAPKMPDTDDIPINVFVPIEPFLNVSEEQCKTAVVTYPSSVQFTRDSNLVFKSNVIRVEAFRLELKDLSNRLIINFTVNSTDIIHENQILLCQFYNETVDRWENTGSFTNLESFNSSNTVTCSYDHMTPFAVLLVNVTQIDGQQWKILSYLTYIGCSLSSFFSAVIIFLYVFIKSTNKDNFLRIHVSLNVAVFLLNTSFLFIEWGVTYGSVCVIIAVVIQYSLLSCFSWMIIEAFHLYLTVVKVFNIYIRQYLLKLSLFGWGVPAVLVGGSLCVFGSTPFYGRKALSLSGTNGTTHFCWITNTHFLYGMNISYFSLTFLFNTCLLVVVTHQIFKLRCLYDKGRRLPSPKDICTVLGLNMLLGTTWGLIFFTSGYTNYPILYLFCICNSLQGLFLFLWFCGTMKRKRHVEAQTSIMSEPTSTTVNTYESSFAQ
ncbi:adhesion G-protein coupled receptor G1-like isoform X6 [Silurus meridionalis]|uniref:adhesion G-protein coupled receptor G1-like isoform X6 n=1 Tax=Silurus meridionalis TaxID=175797 RepID=UPI001EECCE83|nr:adhesion G-protein coupled receptor G1-like isoform X6 [Silurus meridionalis]